MSYAWMDESCTWVMPWGMVQKQCRSWITRTPTSRRAPRHPRACAHGSHRRQPLRGRYRWSPSVRPPPPWGPRPGSRCRRRRPEAAAALQARPEAPNLDTAKPTVRLLSTRCRAAGCRPRDAALRQRRWGEQAMCCCGSKRCRSCRTSGASEKASRIRIELFPYAWRKTVGLPRGAGGGAKPAVRPATPGSGCPPWMSQQQCPVAGSRTHVVQLPRSSVWLRQSAQQSAGLAVVMEFGRIPASTFPPCWSVAVLNAHRSWRSCWRWGLRWRGVGRTHVCGCTNVLSPRTTGRDDG